MAKQLLNEFADIQALDRQKGQIISILDEVIKKQKEMMELGMSFLGSSKTVADTKEATKVIDEEAKAITRMTNESKKLVYTNQELYKVEQQTLQARKEAEKIAKANAQATNDQIGAYKRLEAEAQLATQKFRDLAAQYGIESKEAKEASVRAAELNQKLKDVDATVNLHQKNVGNYKETTMSVRQEIRTLTQALAQMEMQGNANSKEAVEFRKRLGELKDAMSDTQNKAKFFADDARWLNASVQAVQGLVGAYAAWNSVMVLTGSENEELQKSMQKIQALMGVMMGLQQVSNTLQKDSMVVTGASVAMEKLREVQIRLSTRAQIAQNLATETGTIAAKASAVGWNLLASSMKKVPFIAIVSAVITAVAVMVKWANTLSDSAKQQDAYTETLAKSRQSITDQIVSLQNLAAIAKNTKRTDEDRLAALKEIEKTTNGQIKINDLQSTSLLKLDQLTNQYIDTLIRQANVQAAEEKMKEIAKEQIDLQTQLVKIQTDVLDKQGAMNAKFALSITPIEAARLGFKSLTDIIDGLSSGEKINTDIYQNLIDLRSKGIKEQIAENEKLKTSLGIYVSTYKDVQAVEEKVIETKEKATKATKEERAENIALVKALEQINQIIIDIPDSLQKSTDIIENNSPLDKLFDQYKQGEINIQEFVSASGKLLFEHQATYKEVQEGITKVLAEETARRNKIQQDGFNIAAKITQDTFSTISAYMTQSNDEATNKITEQFDASQEAIKNLLDAGVITQQEYNSRIKQLEADRDRDLTEQKRKYAKQQRDLAVFQSIINTAAAVVSALMSGVTLADKIAGAVTVGIMGAAEIAAIYAQPLPTFYKGTENAPEGPAIVGDRHGYEIIQHGNELYRTPNTATLTYLNKGDKVYTHSQSIELDKMLSFPVHSTSTRKSDSEMMLIGKVDELTQAVKNKPSAQINIDKNGFNFMVASGTRRVNYVNNHIRYAR